MRLNFQPGSARVGNIEIHRLSRVVELDAGQVTEPSTSQRLGDGTLNVAFSHNSLQKIEAQLAIVVPCMNEEHRTIKGVLHGIPHDCLIILVSNSEKPNFDAECELLTEFCTNAQRRGIAIHQQDEGLARAFLDAGMPELIDKIPTPQPKRKNAGRIRNGKGEAMMIGTALAKLKGKQFVGFIDADNFVPGAVHEYCKVYAAGLHHALHCTDDKQAPKAHAMVRIKWHSKPKIVGDKLVPREAGRCSRVVNEWMNNLLTTLNGDMSPHNTIQTANAGEHAMSIDLAMELCFATGYAVEPFQLINAWERRTVPRAPMVATNASTAPLSRSVRILQIETLNPHIHDFGKGDEHIQRMQAQGLGTIYHTELAHPNLKEDLLAHMKQSISAVQNADEEPKQARVYPPMQTMDFDVFKTVLKKPMDKLQQENFLQLEY